MLLDIDNRVCRIKLQERSGKIFVKVSSNSTTVELFHIEKN